MGVVARPRSRRAARFAQRCRENVPGWGLAGTWGGDAAAVNRYVQSPQEIAFYDAAMISTKGVCAILSWQTSYVWNPGNRSEAATLIRALHQRADVRARQAGERPRREESPLHQLSAIMTARPYGPMDPNSQHQMWSRWVFGVLASTKHPDRLVCVDNFRRWCRMGFQSSVGRARCDLRRAYYRFVLEIEGPPVHDPAFVESVRQQFVERFMAPGFGPGARLLRFRTKLLAGDRQDGTPPDQLLVMPQADLLYTV